MEMNQKTSEEFKALLSDYDENATTSSNEYFEAIVKFMGLVEQAKIKLEKLRSDECKKASQAAKASVQLKSFPKPLSSLNEKEIPLTSSSLSSSEPSLCKKEIPLTSSSSSSLNEKEIPLTSSSSESLLNDKEIPITSSSCSRTESLIRT